LREQLPCITMMDELIRQTQLQQRLDETPIGDRRIERLGCL